MFIFKKTKYEITNLERPSGNRWVTMQNALIRAGHGLTLSEKRLVMMAVSKIDSAKYHRSNDIPTTRITAAEYAELADCEMQTAYEALQNASKKLYQRSITFYEPAYNRKGNPISSTEIKMRWVGQVNYQKNEGWVELCWWPKLVPYLTNIKKQFTSYHLKQVSALRSIYSWRLLELLTRFQTSGIAKYTIEDFCTSMDCTEKQRQNFNNIKRRIIEPAVTELTQKDGWKIEWNPIKTGRKVTTIEFKFEKDPQGKLF
ncbi:replication initiation protein [Bartonella raoultii]|uniref:Replication initiation protein n=1 Tax=Bartonella raoultii TaxID=1457020 RepID=A0ABS7I6T7_9HYPH|nr:replication initiation protein [Bartonella raoultii]MBX4336616.1 replication initiation protein [Bartonella raoultii]